MKTFASITVLSTFFAGLAVGVSSPSNAGATITEFVDYERPGVRSLFQYAAADRDFRTIIYGNPSAASKQAFDAAVIAAMQGRNWGPTTNFTTTPSESAHKEYRVVMIFSGERHYGGKAACGDVDPGALAPVRDRVRLQAAFCFRDRVLSEVQVKLDAFQGPNDPALDRAVAQAVLHLFPLRDPFIERDNDRDVIVP